MPSNIYTKILGDAGEHYALSRFSFVGKYAAKMPDNWEGYDLAVETGADLLRVSVKTRSESAGWKASKWFIWDEHKSSDWFVFVFKPANSPIRAWVIPRDILLAHSNRPGEKRQNPWMREISWPRLTGSDLLKFEDNWNLQLEGSTDA